MSNRFWIVAGLSLLLITPQLARVILALTVGGYDLGSAISRAFEYSSWSSFLLVLALRSLPFLAMFFVIWWLTDKRFKHLNALAWFWLIGMVAVLLQSYWTMNMALFTEERASSTAAIGHIFVPFVGILAGIVSGLLGVVCSVGQDKLRAQPKTKRHID